MNMALDWSKIGIGVLAIIIGAISAYFGQPLVHDNNQAINVLVTVFSILAGFLIAIIAIIGDPALLPTGTWRAAEMERGKLIKKLIRHKLLFTLYLMTLGVIFLALLLKKSCPQLTIWLERAFLFFGVAAFVFSTRLPSSLMKIQEDKIDAIIKHRKSEVGIKT